jgi:hypothetical protein
MLQCCVKKTVIPNFNRSFNGKKETTNWSSSTTHASESPENHHFSVPLASEEAS